MITDMPVKTTSGLFVLIVVILAIPINVLCLVFSGIFGFVLGVIICALMFPVFVLLLVGLFLTNPNEARVLQLFGKYVGTNTDTGLRWANPFYSKQRISLRVNNFETDHSKVNDSSGNPIEIAAVVVWKVVDAAEAVFEVDDYHHFMRVQSESAIRNLASQYRYDSQTEGEISLRGDIEVIAERLKDEIQGRLHKAGLEVLEARITHLAYAPEIASAMLQRQQAGAIVEARSLIVEGAVSMVQSAIDELEKREIITLEGQQKAAMVSNLLVVLCSERGSQPIVNAGN
ncbi:MAG: SPFH domain-containing protein [Gammaproteobacteria bacterium]|nr:SPFH domain-containing protein [Gammaproteobacteria bacterium]